MRHLILCSMALSAALLLPACAGGGGGGDRADTRGNSGRSASSSPKAGSVQTFSEDTREFMANALKQFSDQDPGWPEARAHWLGLGTREADFLVMTMFASLLHMQRAAQPEHMERARDELVAIGQPSVSFLAEVLAVGTAANVYDEMREETVPLKVDDDSRRASADVLARIGAPAAPALAAAARRAETKSGKRFAIQALGQMGESGGRVAREALITWSVGEDWVLRVEAVHGMRSHTDETTRRALERALSDGDDLVRKKALESLVARHEPASIEAMRSAHAVARTGAKIEEMRLLADAIRRLEDER